MRCFLGIGVDGKLRDGIEGVQKKFEEAGADIKSVGRENLHWTVKFLGDVKENEIKQVDHIRNVLEDYVPFELEVRGVGVFPSMEYIKVIWIGAGEGRRKLKGLIEDIDQCLSEHGFEREKEETVPHITIGRMKSGKRKEGVKETVKELRDKKLGTMSVGNVKLFESELTPDGPVYTIKRRYDL